MLERERGGRPARLIIAHWIRRHEDQQLFWDHVALTFLSLTRTCLAAGWGRLSGRGTSASAATAGQPWLSSTAPPWNPSRSRLFSAQESLRRFTDDAPWKIHHFVHTKWNKHDMKSGSRSRSTPSSAQSHADSDKALTDLHIVRDAMLLQRILRLANVFNLGLWR